MKTILCALITLLPLGLSAAAPAQVDIIRTLHGKTYRQCSILQRDADGVAFKHQKGTARVLYADLPADTRYALGYDARAAAQLERSRAQARAERAEAQRLQQKRAAELRHAARLAEIKQLSQWSQMMMAASYLQGMGGGVAPFPGPVPAVGFAAPGWSGNWGYGYGYGYGSGWPHHHRRPAVSWEGVGIATIGAGSGGVYVPQSGGFIFTGPGPQPVRYSPTLGYYNPGRVPVRSFGTFNVVPGLMAPNPPAVVPGVARHGSVSMPAPR